MPAVFPSRQQAGVHGQCREQPALSALPSALHDVLPGGDPCALYYKGECAIVRWLRAKASRSVYLYYCNPFQTPSGKAYEVAVAAMC